MIGLSRATSRAILIHGHQNPATSNKNNTFATETELNWNSEMSRPGQCAWLRSSSIHSLVLGAESGEGQRQSLPLKLFMCLHRQSLTKSQSALGGSKTKMAIDKKKIHSTMRI